MNQRERMKRKIEAETDQWKRLWMQLHYICKYCSTEQKNSLEKFIREQAGYPEKAEASCRMAQP